MDYFGSVLTWNVCKDDLPDCVNAANACLLTQQHPSFMATCATSSMRVIASVQPHQSITSKHTFVCLVFTVPPYCSEWRDLKYALHNTFQDKAVSRQQLFERAWQIMHVLETSMMHFMHRHCHSPSLPPHIRRCLLTDDILESMFVSLWAQKKSSVDSVKIILSNIGHIICLLTAHSSSD